MPGLQAWRAVWVAGPGQVDATTANGGSYVGGGDSGWAQMDNVLLVGAEGTIAHWDGSNWAQVPIQPDPSEDPNADPVPVTELLYGCATLDPNRAWAVGSNETYPNNFWLMESPEPGTRRDVGGQGSRG